MPDVKLQWKSCSPMMIISMTSDPSDEINNDDFMLECDAHMFHKIQTLGSTIENKKNESHVFARARSIVGIF